MTTKKTVKDIGGFTTVGKRSYIKEVDQEEFEANFPLYFKREDAASHDDSEAESDDIVMEYPKPSKPKSIATSRVKKWKKYEAGKWSDEIAI